MSSDSADQNVELLQLHGTNKQSVIADGDYRIVSFGAWSMFFDGDALPPDFKDDFDKETHCALFFKNQTLVPQAKAALTQNGLQAEERNRWIYDVCPDLNTVVTTDAVKGYKLSKNFDGYDENDEDDQQVVKAYGYKDVADAKLRGIGYDVLFGGEWVGSASLTAAASDRTRDIRVEITAAHQNKGVGSYVAGIVVEECLREDAGIPVWDAPSIISARVGAKIGFSGRRKYQVLLINGVEGYPERTMQKPREEPEAVASSVAVSAPPPVAVAVGSIQPPPPMATHLSSGTTSVRSVVAVAPPQQIGGIGAGEAARQAEIAAARQQQQAVAARQAEQAKQQQEAARAAQQAEIEKQAANAARQQQAELARQAAAAQAAEAARQQQAELARQAAAAQAEAAKQAEIARKQKEAADAAAAAQQQAAAQQAAARVAQEAKLAEEKRIAEGKRKAVAEAAVSAVAPTPTPPTAPAATTTAAAVVVAAAVAAPVQPPAAKKMKPAIPAVAPAAGAVPGAAVAAPAPAPASATDNDLGVQPMVE